MSEDTHLTIKIEPLTLVTCADGILEDDFQKALKQVAQAFECLDDPFLVGIGKREVKISPRPDNA